MSSDTAAAPAADVAVRPVPEVTYLSRAFWTGGSRGELRIQRCSDCQVWQHPPRARCPRCGSAQVEYPAVSGRGKIFTFTIIHHCYRPGVPLPIVVALVELDEQPGLRITSNVTGCRPDQVSIDQAVEVVFEEQPGGIFIPLFQPMDMESTTAC